MKFKKIKHLNSGISLEWIENLGNGKSATRTLESPEMPRQEFINALQGLKPYLIQICELESLDQDLIDITGVGFSYKGSENLMEVVLKGKRSYKNSNGCDTFNAPKKKVETAGEPTAEENLLDEEGVEILNTLISEGELYIKGERLQTDMFDEEGEDE